jgi:transposase
MVDAAKIPLDDTSALRKTLRGVAETSDVATLIELVISLLANLSSENKRMALRLQKVLRSLHARKSEKLDPAQLSLFQELLKDGEKKDPSDQDPPPAEEGGTRPIKKKKGHGRNKFPEDLERVENIIAVADEERKCAICGTEKICIGHSVSERLDYIPASIRVIKDMREKLACKPCQGSMSIAPVAPHLIEGGAAAESLLAHVMVSKYYDGLPLTRLKKIYARSGVEIAESTLGDFVRQTAMHLGGLAKAIEAKVLASHCINQDDTGIRVLDKDHHKGIKRGHIYANVGDGYVAYKFAPDWKGEHPVEFLRGYSGIVQGDGYAGINTLFKGKDAPTRAGCFMHLRRYFFDAFKAGDQNAGIPLALIGSIYKIEAAAKRDLLPPMERQNLRAEKSMPIIRRLEDFIENFRGTVAPKSELGKALTYATNQWPALLVPFGDGRLEIDNSEAERQLKVLAIGRKNWLFAGSDSGGERAATALTVLATCVWQGVNPLAYLTSVLTSIAHGFPSSRIGELLPLAWAEKHGQQVKPQASILPRLID